jgi:two-component system chemotaxis sensor kinase CheA
MSSTIAPISHEKNGLAPSLQERIEELAGKLVLGGLPIEAYRAMLAGIEEAARLAGAERLEPMAAEARAALTSVQSGAEAEGLLGSRVEAMQRTFWEPEMPVAVPADNASASSATLTIDDPQLMGDFVTESLEHLSQVEIQMLILEKDPEDKPAIDTVFRGFHTIKGLAGFLDLTDVREVAHETETLLDLARKGQLRISPAVVDIVLAAADFLKAWLNRITAVLEGQQPEQEPEKEALLVRIRAGAQPGGQSDTKPQAAVESAAPAPKPVAQAAAPEPLPDAASKAIAEAAQPAVPSPMPPAVEEPARNVTGERKPATAEKVAGEDIRTVKVQTSKLDFLVDMAGELVIVQSMVRHHPELAALHNPAALRNLAQLERITGELQKTAMSMRMVPVGGLFQKMNRLVRDLARKTGKQVEMESFGADTELDRNVVEELADPLMHMIRNAVDHGIEAPEGRLAAGKSVVGKVTLRASHQAGHIVIAIADDGRGLVRAKIVEKAKKTGLIETDQGMSDREVFDLIFAPGFSTAAAVTDVSGRGVGMDVVKQQIQKLRGHVDIESAPGKGTTFYLRLPLTLAMIDGLVVGVGEERYVVPLFSVREMLRPTPEMLFSVENRQEMGLVRNNLIPVVRLHERFGVEPRSREATDSLWIVAEAAGKSFCLMVDELIGKQEVVIKSLGESLKNVPGIAGGAILGDGRVGLILDLESIFRWEARVA